MPPDERDIVSPFRPSRLAANEQNALAALRRLSIYTSPGRTYARVGVRDLARMYVCGHIFWHLAVRTCTQFRRGCLNCYVGGMLSLPMPPTRRRLLLHVPLLARPWFIVEERPIEQYARTRSRQRYVRFDRVGPNC